MNKETALRLILYLLVTIGAFAFGRYTMSFKPIEEIKKTQDQETTTQRTIIIVKRPDGTEETTDTTNSVTRSRTSEESLTTPVKRSKLNISALVTTKLSDLKPVYGLSISKEVLGPITLGGFVLQDGRFGVSLGVNF